MISWEDDIVEAFVWFDPRRQTPERKEALDNRWWLQMVPSHLFTTHTPLGGKLPIVITPQSDGQDLIDFSFMSLVPSHVQWLSPAQQWGPPPFLEEMVARMEQRQGIIGYLYGKLEDKVVELKVKEGEYN
ncbi:hypothetical protein SERLADRAFT_404667 [Serpula lacrymans var. lacrymans S7.9]|uniref:Uncharacterized protein n=1 Tax=Serpula lacrymans var. lacrymans (strain S7.9) TaxID=578457 RepID=F8NE12_SERL9|nr:uncharacterized protein SERLADRAFT_404667 [Serpula lacrymans var. lacrymans S7.9]EGO30540.1 hypothetical protein SERLADRAFT_404667 [Serpula lacrymans var. lacrymans S7.9]